MSRKTIFSSVIVICMIALAACATATPTATTSNSNAIPTATSNTNTNATTPAASSNTSVSMDPSLACSGGKTSASETVALTEGPYFTAGSPERASLLDAGMAGTKLVITGYVYDTNCQPIANASLDFWQADANGVYDNSGYTLRGHQFTDANGHYELTTVVPGLYPGRTEHIHFKVQAPNGKLITSQLFFPGVQQNDSDGIYAASLLLSIQQTDAEWQGQYNFVVPAR
ncbi:MAG: dioxygenase [Chloroflexota bacterium]